MENIFRVLKNSWRNFSRNLWISMAAMFMMFTALSVIGTLFLFNASLSKFVSGLQDRVDVSAYFEKGTAEEEILAVKIQLENRENVKSVRYISENEALDIFTQTHQGNEILLNSLEELDENPLQASLNIRVNDPSLFSREVAFLENSSASEYVESINFKENEEVINTVSNISANVSRGGFIFIIGLGMLVILVTLNTIRVAIYSAREEIYIMKLVGASNWFVRMPFVLTGAWYGLISGLLVVGFSYLGTWLLHSRVSLIFADIDLYGYLVQNLFTYSALVLGAGLLIGTSSSWIAVRRYLNV
ncbi:MAG: permease-like cell division protein FtsX [Candidatus Spechtbacteria bacterium]|nr:permease-like cell division protein FtsX [Candidatus Spechtbacteria bacterium]